MKQKQTILIVLLAAVTLTAIFVAIALHRRRGSQRQPERELSVAEQKQNWERSVQALRDLKIELDEKVDALRKRIPHGPDAVARQARAEEVDRWEQIFGRLKHGLEMDLAIQEEESANWSERTRNNLGRISSVRRMMSESFPASETNGTRRPQL